jgi:MFS family permease
MLGYLLDAADVVLYLFALQTLRAEFGMSNATAGLVSSITLITSAIGGIAAGIVSDRIGRKRTLIYTILSYSLASAGTATASSVGELMFWRAIVGLGLGGEWSAGATLVAESWPASHRGKAIAFMQSGWALGNMLAAVATALILPRFGWRVLFLVGVLPALLTIWVRRRVSEPAVWNPHQVSPPSELFRPPLLRRTLLATSAATFVLFGYWGLFTWLPGFLSAPVERGGAGLNIVRTSQWVFLLQAGAFAGYMSFGFLSDRLGRRPTFAAYCLIAAVLAPLYGAAPRWGGNSAETWLLVLGPLVGFFGTGYFALFGAMLAELYPTRIRGAGQGLTYNFGRGLSALAPYLVGAFADRSGLGTALAVNSAFYLVGAALIFTLPETKNTDLGS